MRWAISIVALIAGGCASTQLNSNALDLAGTVDKLVQNQILYNLSKFIVTPDAIPTQVNIPSGAVTTTNTLTASYSDPFSKAVAVANTVTGTTPAHAKTTTSASQTVTPGATDTWTQTWSLNTITDPDQVRRVRALYRFALGYTGSSADSNCGTKTSLYRFCFEDEYPLVRKLTTGQTTAFFVDPTYLTKPGCILCARDPATFLSPATVKEGDLIRNENLTQGWLNWEPIEGGQPRYEHNRAEDYLGTYGGFHLWVRDREAMSQFVMFILEATSMSSSLGGGGGGSKTNNNGSILLVPTGG